MPGGGHCLSWSVIIELCVLQTIFKLLVIINIQNYFNRGIIHTFLWKGIIIFLNILRFSMIKEVELIIIAIEYTSLARAATRRACR